MKGTQRVKRVINKFVSLIKELDKGIVEIDEEVGFNESVIVGLQANNTKLSEERATAAHVVKNLRRLIDD